MLTSTYGHAEYRQAKFNDTLTINSEDLWGFYLFHQLHRISMKHGVHKGEVDMPDTQPTKKTKPIVAYN